MKKLTVAVTGINSVENPGSGIGVIRSLLESGRDIDCVGLGYDAMEPGFYLDEYVKKAYLLPYPLTQSDEYIKRIFSICEENKIDSIIPVFDSELPHFIKNKNCFLERGIKLLLPEKEIFDISKKDRLSELSKLIGIKLPETKTVTSYEEMSIAIEKMNFPVIIKGCFYEAYKVNNYVEAKHTFSKLALKWGFPIIVQKYIKGQDYNLIGCGGIGQVSLGQVCLKKLLTTQAGKIWTAVTIKNDKMLEMGKKFISTTKWQGGYELEFRLGEDENLYLIEVNPRFPSWIYLATGSGINLPLRYLENLFLDKREFSQEYEIGKLLVRYTGEVIRDISDFENIAIKGEK